VAYFFWATLYNKESTLHRSYCCTNIGLYLFMRAKILTGDVMCSAPADQIISTSCE